MKKDIGYLVDFEKAIENHDAPSILRLWEEYTYCDEEVDGEDLRAILEAVKRSTLSEYIGRHIERAIPLWEKIENRPIADEVLRLIIDLEVTESETLRSLALHFLKEKFGQEKQYLEKMHLIGLRSRTSNFKGSISNYLLLSHMHKGNFVFHASGWGVGEIIEVSLLREQLIIEFDYVPGRKEVSFSVAFSTLIPLSADHFLARRFGNPDALEAKAQEDPVAIIHMLLKDLGPKNAAEIKDELYGLVIPEAQWNRWWQTARSKVKKDTHIESPTDLKQPFRLFKEEISHEDRFQKALDRKPDAGMTIQMVYDFSKDFPQAFKNPAFRESLSTRLKELISFKEISEAQELQLLFFLQDLQEEKEYPPIAQLIKKTEGIEKLIGGISIQALKKRAIVQVRKYRSDWKEILLNLLFTVDQGQLRDHILAELVESGVVKELETRFIHLCATPQKYPELVIWYMQKLIGATDLPLANPEGRSTFFEAFLILLSYLEQQVDRRDLVKKMHKILSDDRYAIVRGIMKEVPVANVQEFQLLVTKCHSLSDHDIKIFHSLAEVAHPSLARKGAPAQEVEDIIWTTREGYAILQKRIEQIATVETVENAKEIETARAHGDLRENGEFKAALEARGRLQAELESLSRQLSHSRILTEQDIDLNRVGIGTTVDFVTKRGEKISYTLLGPWDANAERNILSFQSKLAKQLLGLKKGDTIEIQGKEYAIAEIRSAL